MGTRAIPLQFVCLACGAQRETRSNSSKGLFCNPRCRAAFQRKGREHVRGYIQAGYRMLRWNDGGKHRYQFEHRRVWEDANGPIPDGHIIHHINGDKLDNRLENLQCLRRYDHSQEHATYKTLDERLAAAAAREKRYRNDNRLDPEWVERERARCRERNRRIRSAAR